MPHPNQNTTTNAPPTTTTTTTAAATPNPRTGPNRPAAAPVNCASAVAVAFVLDDGIIIIDDIVVLISAEDAAAAAVAMPPPSTVFGSAATVEVAIPDRLVTTLATAGVVAVIDVVGVAPATVAEMVIPTVSQSICANVSAAGSFQRG